MTNLWSPWCFLTLSVGTTCLLCCCCLLLLSCHHHHWQNWGAVATVSTLVTLVDLWLMGVVVLLSYYSPPSKQSSLFWYTWCSYTTFLWREYNRLFVVFVGGWGKEGCLQLAHHEPSGALRLDPLTQDLILLPILGVGRERWSEEVLLNGEISPFLLLQVRLLFQWVGCGVLDVRK